MAYCPLAQAGRLRDGLFQHTDIINMANARGVTVAQLLLAGDSSSGNAGDPESGDYRACGAECRRA